MCVWEKIRETGGEERLCVSVCKEGVSDGT